MVRRLVDMLLASVLLSSGFAPKAEHSTLAGDQRLTGTWRLAAFDGAGRRDLGAHPIGLLYYDATGHMAAQISPDRSRPSWTPNTQPTPEQAQAAVTGYTAYFGTYSVDERAGTVTHHREAALNNYVTDVVRKYELDATGDRLTLMPLERENAGIRLTWERIRQ